MPARARRTAPDHGAVTAETAVLLPAFGLVLAFGLWAVGAVTGQLRCVDAARSAARELARGESRADALAVARAAAPAGARVVVASHGAVLVVEVTARTRLPGPWSGGLPGVTLTGRAVTPVEGDVAAIPP